MSKKLTLLLSDNNRPNLSLLFHDYLRNRKKGCGRKRNLGNGLIVDEDDEYYAEIIEYWDNVFPGWDDSLSDDYETVFPLRENSSRSTGSRRTNNKIYWNQESREDGWGKKKKHKRHGRKNRARIVDINEPTDGYIGEFCEYEDITDSTKIIFYNDYHDKFDRTEFISLKEFSDFCDEMGYTVPGYVQDELLYRNESHCCLDPKSESRGILEVVSEPSYGELFYEVCEPSELD